MKVVILILNLLIASIGYGQNKVWLIGTAHEKRSYINPDSLTIVLNKIKPDLILIELEDKHFTRDFKFDLAKYSLEDFLVNNENIASYKYQQEHGVQLRPFDMNGRHDFYEKEHYHERENEMFSAMLKLYKNNELSESCKADFEILLSALNSYSELDFTSLREANSDVATKFIALKTKIDFELIVSIIIRTEKLNNWLGFANLRKDFWDKRNSRMAENIIKYAKEFGGKRVVVLVGNDHKYVLTELLRRDNFKVNNYYE